MDKSILERFIAKYNLNGTAESVIWAVENNKLSTKFCVEDKDALGFISTTGVDIPDGSYGIYDTRQLKSLLGVLGPEISISPITHASNVTGLLFKDDHTKVTYALADEQNIPKAPDPKKMPPFEVIVNIDDRFLQTYIRSQAALGDDTFTIMSDGTDTSLVLGYSDNNANRINMKVTTQQCEPIQPIGFRANYLREMLVANRELSSGTLSISTQGISELVLTVNGFNVVYYLPAVST